MSKRCLKCNYLNSNDALRCAACSAPLTQICPRCGAALPLGTHSCPKCDRADPSDTSLFTEMFQAAPQQRAIKGRYLVLSALSRGKVGAIYRVRDRQSNQEYALKELTEIALLTSDEKRLARSRFQEQAEGWASLAHRNLPRPLEAFSTTDRHYLLMPLIDGWNLSQLIQRATLPLDEETIRNWGAQIAELLTYLHQQQPALLLADLKPEHVMVTRAGLVQLVDFGLTRLFLPEREADFRFAPASPYVAPELRAAAPTPAADFYSVGALLYALAARRLLTAASKIPGSLRQAMPTLSRPLEAAILRATRRDPAARFGSAAELREALWGQEAIPLEALGALESEARQTPQATIFGPRTLAPQTPSPALLPRATPAAPGAKAKLLIRPRRIEIEGLGPQDKKQVTITLHNAGDTPIEGRAVSQVPWLTLRSGAFQCPQGKACEISLTIWGARLPLGGAADPQALLIDSNAGRYWLSVEAQVPVSPVLSLSSDILDLGELQETKDVNHTLVITNSGGGTLKGRVQSRLPWLQIPNPDFQCGPQRSAQIQLVLKGKLLPTGAHDEIGALIADSDAGQVHLTVRARRLQPLLGASPSWLEFGALRAGDKVERVLTISNRGTGILDYTLLSRAPWLSVSAPAGRCGVGSSSQVALTLDAAQLSEGLHESSEAVLIQSNGGSIKIAVRVRVLAPKLALDVHSLDLGEIPLGQVAERYLTVRNAGSAPLSGHLESALNWLRLSPVELSIAAQGAALVLVSADTSHLSRGQVIHIPAALCFSSDGGNLALPLDLVVVKPTLEVEPPTLDFGITDRITPVRQRLLIRNRDTGLLEWRIETDAQWVDIAPRQGICRAGGEFEIEVAAYGLALPEGAESARGKLWVRSNGGEREIALAIQIASPLLDVDVTQLELGTSINYAPLEATFRLFNRGLGPLRGGIKTRSEKWSVEPAAFDCAMGMLQTIRVRAVTEGLPVGAFHDARAITIESNGGQAELGIAFHIVLKPRIEASLTPLTHQLGEWPAQGKLTIKNAGLEAAQVTIAPNAAALDVTRRSYTIKPGKAVNLQVTLAGTVAEPCLQISTEEELLSLPVILETVSS